MLRKARLRGVRTHRRIARTSSPLRTGGKRAVSSPTLRLCYATHLLEAGVNPRVIQRHMGHASLESTMLYLHLTHKGTEDAYAVIDRVMEGL